MVDDGVDHRRVDESSLLSDFLLARNRCISAANPIHEPIQYETFCREKLSLKPEKNSGFLKYTGSILQ